MKDPSVKEEKEESSTPVKMNGVEETRVACQYLDVDHEEIDEVNAILKQYDLQNNCSCGGTGRHTRLKSEPLAGSIPAMSTCAKQNSRFHSTKRCTDEC